ncbi:MAG: T9SS type A sorting domain-containing protein [Paludibacteraceae bacterium]|nr:T9SS type A sorting domain-containing protein [Paludibacteraceae bacterium]
MKRTLFLLALTFLMTEVRAESSLVVEPLNGSGQVLALSQIGKLVAQSDYVYFYAKDKTLLAKYETSEIRRLSFGTPTDDVLVSAAKVSVYPNPAQDALIVSGAEGEQLRVYDMQGGLLLTQPVTGEETTINVSTLPTGTYLLLTGKQVIRFIKQ